MTILNYSLQRLLLTIPVVIGASLLVFSVMYLTPSSPVEIMLGPYATPEQVDKLRSDLWLDKPFYMQYLRWAGNVIRGDLGRSFYTQNAVIDDLRRALPATLELALVALVVVAVLALIMGVTAAVHKDRLLDHLSRVISLIGVATPIFWLGLLAQLLFYEHWSLLPAGGRANARLMLDHPVRAITGMLTVDSLLTGNWAMLRSASVHLVLPALVLASRSMALLSRLMRTSMLEALSEDYVRTAHAYGYRPVAVVAKYTLRNALLPFVTVLGLQFGQLLGGTFLIESVFDWPGMGLYGLQAIQAGDFPALLGVVMVVTLAYLMAGLVSDLLYSLIDPRIRY